MRPLKLSANAFSIGLPGRPDDMQLDAVGVGPGVQGPAGEFGTVVADDHRRQRPRRGNTVEHGGNAESGQRGIDLRCDRFAAVVVDVFSIRNVRPVAKLSHMKSIDHRSFGAVGGASTMRVPAASSFVEVHRGIAGVIGRPPVPGSLAFGRKLLSDAQASSSVP